MEITKKEEHREGISYFSLKVSGMISLKKQHVSHLLKGVKVYQAAKE